MERRPTVTRHVSPLRYPGVKGRLHPFVGALIEHNGLSEPQYYEPYAGSAALGLHLLLRGFVSGVHLNDLDPNIASFWRCLLDHTEELLRYVADVDISLETWDQANQICHSDADIGDVERGCATFFLNRTNRSGIIRKGGMIGGRAQAGRWKLDARFNRETLANRIQRIAWFASRITVSQTDALRFVASHGKDKAPVTPAVWFVDPPYHDAGANLYLNSYSAADHQRIAKSFKNSGLNWIVTYNDHPFIRECYEGAPALELSWFYSAARRGKGNEVLFHSRSLATPTFGPRLLPQA